MWWEKNCLYSTVGQMFGFSEIIFTDRNLPLYTHISSFTRSLFICFFTKDFTGTFPAQIEACGSKPKSHNSLVQTAEFISHEQWVLGNPWSRRINDAHFINFHTLICSIARQTQKKTQKRLVWISENYLIHFHLYFSCLSVAIHSINLLKCIWVVLPLKYMILGK